MTPRRSQTTGAAFRVANMSVIAVLERSVWLLVAAVQLEPVQYGGIGRLQKRTVRFALDASPLDAFGSVCFDVAFSSPSVPALRPNLLRCSDSLLLSLSL